MTPIFRSIKFLIISFIVPTMLFGCGMIETYYVLPSSEVKAYIERLKAASKKGEEAEKIFEEMRFFLDNLEVFIKTSKDDKFQVQMISRIDPKLIDGRNWSIDFRRTLGRTEIQSFDNCFYIDDRNWNCGRSEDDMDRLKMVNGDFYSDGKRFIKKYRIKS